MRTLFGVLMITIGIPLVLLGILVIIICTRDVNLQGGASIGLLMVLVGSGLSLLGWSSLGKDKW